MGYRLAVRSVRSPSWRTSSPRSRLLRPRKRIELGEAASPETTTAQQPGRSLRRLIGPPEGAEGGLEKTGTLDRITEACAPAHPTACGSDATLLDDRLWTARNASDRSRFEGEHGAPI